MGASLRRGGSSARSRSAWISPALWPWSLALAAALAVAVVVSVHAWRRGADAMALAPITAAWPWVSWSSTASSPRPITRGAATASWPATLGRLVPRDVRSVHFFNEVDEGLWFYLDGLDLLPVPGTQPRYNTAYDLAGPIAPAAIRPTRSETLDVRREALEKQALLHWLDRPALGHLLSADPRRASSIATPASWPAA